MEQSSQDPKDPFENCALGRKRYALALNKIISSSQEGNVIGLNNRWGAGKTTFVNMWRGLLEQEGFTTIYFNAWESDFEENPLSALMAELKSVLQSGKDFDSLLNHGGQILLNITSTLVTRLIDRKIGEGTAADIAKSLTGQAKDIFKEEISDYISTKDSIIKFRKALVDYIERNCDKVPMIFFVDELDRCRPSYAVKVMETIKHIFAVPNITFVLSIDKEQLGYAVQGFYGSDKIDTKEYLRRFIDIEFSLPAPDMDRYYNFLFKKFDIWKKASTEYNYDGIESIKKPMKYLFKYFTLRQMDKVCMHIKLIMDSTHVNAASFNVLFFLIYLRYNDDSLYNKIKSSKIMAQDLSDSIYQIYLTMPNSNGVDGEILMSYIESELLFIYDQYRIRNRIIQNTFYSYDQQNTFQSSIISKINNNYFGQNLSELARRTQYEPQDFETIFDMIELCPK